jgi:hypothetical protein
MTTALVVFVLTKTASIVELQLIVTMMRVADDLASVPKRPVSHA